MKILVDTCIWSLALHRRKKDDDNIVYIKEFSELICESRIQLIGAVRQEILSGIKHESQFVKLKNILQSFSDFNVQMNDYEHAAALFNIARSHGISGSNTDFLICALSEIYDMPIFTIDNDFDLYRQYMKFKRYYPR